MMNSNMLYQKYAITQSLALKILEAITNKAEELGIKINAAVVDEGANLKAFIRMDEAALLSSRLLRIKLTQQQLLGNQHMSGIQ